MALPLLAEVGHQPKKKLNTGAIYIDPFTHISDRGRVGFLHLLAQSKLTLAPRLSMRPGPQ
jgi:hypothetical protein